MSKRPNVSRLSSGFRSSNKLNDNIDQINNAFDNTLSRDGSGPNEMLAALDMNNNPILNIPAPVADTDLVRKQDVQDIAVNFVTEEIENVAAVAGASAGSTAGTTAATNVLANKADVAGANIVNKQAFRYNILSAPLDKKVYASDYGVMADGTTDDTVALNSALAAAADIQGLSTVVLPVGVIRYTSSLPLIRSNFSLIGQGSGATILRLDAANTNGLFIRSPTVNGALSNITLTGLSFDVAAGRSTTTGGFGLYAEKVIGLSLNDVKGSGFNKDCVLAGCFDTIAMGCTFIGGNTTPDGRGGLYITVATAPYGGAYGGNLKFFGCEVRTATGQTGTPGYDVCLKVDGVDGAFFDSCYFGYGATSAADIIKNGALIAGVKFSNCWFDAAAGTNVRFLNSGTANGGVTFTGCQWVGGSSVDRNFVAVGDWTDITITGGSMQWANFDNMHFAGTQRVNISGVSLSLADGDNAAGGEGINLQGCTDVTINGVLIDGMGFTDNGILIANGSGVIATGNRVKGCINGIITSGTLNNYIVRSNGVSGNSGNPVLDLATGVNKSVGDNV